MYDNHSHLNADRALVKYEDENEEEEKPIVWDRMPYFYEELKRGLSLARAIDNPKQHPH